MNLSPAELAVLGTIGGTIAGGIFTAIAAFIAKRSEERKHFRELIVKTAFENWKHVSQISAVPFMPPLTDYIVHMVLMCDLVLNKKIDSKNIQSKLDEIKAIGDILNKHAINISKGK